MISGIKPVCFLLMLAGMTQHEALGNPKSFSLSNTHFRLDTVNQDSIDFLKKLHLINRKVAQGDSVNMSLMETKQYISPQQMVKGSVAGVLVEGTTGEPGRSQNMYIRGISRPYIYKSDLHSIQPLYILDGIPLIGDHPFVYDIKKYDVVNIGPATNVLANSDIDNIHSIEVIKDPAVLAQYGPMAANGVILIRTKQAAVGKRQISINSYFGVNSKESITPVNADYENRFRSQFYDKYATNEMKLTYAGYLRDSTNTDYYGPTNWHKKYYNQDFTHNVNLSITGGSERANFRFYGGVNNSPGTADETKFQRYNGAFYINMLPFKWMTMSSMVNVSRLNRDRNRNFRDRYNETGYLPDLSTPLPPGGNIYSNYLNEYDKVIDDNFNNLIKGYVSLKFDLSSKLKYTTQFSFDYGQSIRDVFWPTTLMETINFVSNYFGYNQRFNVSNKLNYDLSLGEDQGINFEVGHIYWADKYRYNYATAYDGPSDFIKVNVVQGNASEGGYLSPVGFMTYRYTDNLEHRLSSFYGTARYNYQDALDLSVTLRTDGSSNRMPDKRWYLSRAFAAKYNLLALTGTSDNVNRLTLGASYSRVGETFNSDQYAYGPQYRTDLGWDKEPNMLSYNGFATVSRPYTQGWVSYDIKTPYSDKVNLQLAGTFFKGLLDLDLNVYSNTSKDLPLMTSVAQEYGYKGKLSSGMSINNRGVEGQVTVRTQQPKTLLNWESSFFIGYNKNELKSLPENLDQLVIGNRLLKVGESVSKHWLYENIGIVSDASTVGSNFNGIPFQAGDALWKDQNNDQIVNSKDKVYKGEMIAPLTGGWNNSFTWKNWKLDVSSYFHLGNKILNTAVANHYDFINNEQSNDLNSVKEIYQWQQLYDLTKYPIYNPWSSTVPYRKDQDLFIEDGSFFKLRAFTIGYDLTTMLPNTKNLKRLYVYGTASNLFTVSNFSGIDPEFVSIDGNYDGYGMTSPKTFVLGFKIDL